ncbi:MAG: hypothetical protein K9M07_06500 [Simkaniaceae bacterium]|nr:hypothetical protein [Simkaniaceae bacterium]
MFLIVKGYGYGLELIQVQSLNEISSEKIQIAEQILLVILSVGFILGYLKGRLVFVRVANRMIKKLVQFEEPLPLSVIFSIRYLIVIAVMMGLGMLMRYLPIRLDIKAIVDFAVGIGLIYGSIYQFRQAFVFRKELPQDIQK